MKRALVLSLICVLGLAITGFAESLTGSWDTDVTIDPLQTNFNDAITLVSVLTVNYIVGDWTFTSITSLSQGGWTDQDFNVIGVLGAFTLSSKLDFVPATQTFGSWVTTASVSIAGVSFGAEFKLDGTDAFLKLTGSGVAGDVTVGVVANFGSATPAGCELNFTDVTITLGFPFCCADISASIKFTCAGFDNITFTTGGIAIPNLPWVTIGAKLVYTMDEKDLTLTTAFDFGVIACFDLYISVTDAPVVDKGWVFDKISIDGIKLECIIGGVTFTGISYWGAGVSPIKAGYWEMYKIATTDDACCGPLPFGFDLSVYFLDVGARLFEVGLIEANVLLPFADQFTFNMGLEINVETAAFTKWIVGFLVTW